MRTIMVDDDLFAMEGFKEECGDIDDIDIVGEFNNPVDALEFAKNNLVEFALLDVEMPEMTGIELSEKLREIYPEVIIVLVTYNSKRAVDAINANADYVVFKPYNREDVLNVLSRVRLYKKRLKKRVVCKTFGYFHVFIDGRPVKFKMAKAKELFALCVMKRGGIVSNDEIVNKLWEEYDGYSRDFSGLRMAVKELRDTLKEYNCSDVFKRDRAMCYVDSDMIECDYYDFLDGDKTAVCDFQGEFLSDYSWGETTLSSLVARKNHIFGENVEK